MSHYRYSGNDFDYAVWIILFAALACIIIFS